MDDFARATTPFHKEGKADIQSDELGQGFIRRANRKGDELGHIKHRVRTAELSCAYGGYFYLSTSLKGGGT